MIFGFPPAGWMVVSPASGSLVHGFLIRFVWVMLPEFNGVAAGLSLSGFLMMFTLDFVCFF